MLIILLSIICFLFSYNLIFILENLDFYVELLIIFAQGLLIYSQLTNNIFCFRIVHFIYGLNILLLLYITINKFLLYMYIFIGSLHIITRFIFDKCIMRNYDGNMKEKHLTNNEYVNKFNWDNVALSGIILSIFQLYTNNNID